jgi:drug/metabolite transporter (DMT)-like permease
MEEQGNNKGSNDMVILGFTISLLAVAMWYIVFSFVAIVTITQTANGTLWAIVWTCFSALGLILSVMARRKAAQQTWQRSLSSSGIVLGLVAMVLCVGLFYGLAHKEELMNKLPKNTSNETKSEQNIDNDIDKVNQQLNGGH